MTYLQEFLFGLLILIVIFPAWIFYLTKEETESE